MSTSQIEVQHQADQQQFVLNVENHQAVLQYELQKNAAGAPAIDFYRTYVPPEFRGKGFAEKLVRQGLSWAKDQGYEIRASCWYVQKFLRD